MAKPLLSSGLSSTDAAIAWFRKRIPIPDAELAELDENAARSAFWVAGVSQLRMVNDIFDALDVALDVGSTLEDFKASVSDKLTRAWGSEQPHRVETIFRTNIQRAYMAGRLREMQDPAVKRLRPLLRYDAIMDEAVCPICDGCDETVLPQDDDFWADHTPPLHHQCRCTLVSLAEDDVEPGEVGLDGDEPDAHEGFGSPPDLSDVEVQDLSGIDPELLAAYNDRDVEP